MSPLISLLITLVVVLVVAYIVFLAVDYLLPQQPLNKIIKLIVGLVALLVFLQKTGALVGLGL